MSMQAVLWHEFRIFRNKFWAVTTGSLISPLLYIIAFGWGLGSNITVEGMSYINFIIPGLIAMTTMTASFSQIAIDINISREYDNTFEIFMTAPISMLSYTFGKIISGALRSLYAAFIIVIVAFIFKSGLNISIYFVSAAFLNAMIFSTLGFIIGISVKSYTDISKLTNFIITPMSFLCGTFFPLEKLPAALNKFLLYLPLTQTSMALRSGWYGLKSLSNIAFLLLYFIIFLFIAVSLCKKTE